MGFFDAFDFGGGFDLGDVGQSFLEGAGGFSPEFSFNIPDFNPTFDLGQFDQSFNLGSVGQSFQPGGTWPAGDLGGYSFDTASQEIVSPAGDRTPLSQIMERGNLAGFPQSSIDQAANQVPAGYSSDLTQAYGGGAAGPSPQGPGLFQKGGTLGSGGGIDQFLKSGVGGGLASLGIGGAGLLLSRALAGETPRLQLPAPQQSAATSAGQQSLLNAFNQGLGTDVTGALRAGVQGQQNLASALPGLSFDDPIQQALQTQVMSILGGQGPANPGTPIRQQREEQTLRQQLFRQLGQDYELTTPGIQALNELKQRHNAETFNENEAMLNARLPAEQSRQQFAYMAPTQRAQAQQGVYGSIAPIGSLLGTNAAETAVNQQNQYAAQQALTDFTQRAQNQQQLAAGVGGLFGKVAETATRPRSRLDEYLMAQGY